MTKLFFLGLALGLGLLLIINTGALRPRQKSAEQIQYQKELADATPVQSRVLTERQRIHSRRFSFYREVRANTISELVAHAKSMGHLTAGVGLFPGLGPVREPEAPETFFGELARTSDAVIRGRVTKKTSQVTEDDAFLFTDYDVEVAEVLKDNAAAPLAPGTTITVTWPGGKVLLDGVIVTAIDQNLLPLPTNGHDIVLFMKFLPQTGAYYNAPGNAAYEIDGTSVQPLTPRSFLPPGVIQDRDSFLGAIRAVSAK